MSSTIAIDDYYPVDLGPRYGYEKPVHARILAVLELGLPAYRRTLESFVQFIPQLLQIRRDPDVNAPAEPAWVNGWFPGLDSIALFGLISVHCPRLFLEIGSGNSTRFAAKAKALNSPATRIISIDPHPRVDIDSLCDEVIRAPLESVDLGVVDQLGPGDLLFFDGSHRALENSDVTVFFLDVLPKLKSGVYVHLHDIFWPHDYPREWKNRLYSEQYMLAMLLLFGLEQFRIVLPNTYISWHTKLGKLFDEVWHAPHLAGIEQHGGSFWLLKTGAATGQAG